jgi:predicted GNAT superfamily acetyltransferase
MTVAISAAAATDALERAVRRAGVDILELATPEATARGAEVLQEVWGGAQTVLPANTMRAVQHTGGYCHGAYDAAGQLLAVSLGLLAENGSLHSHITGVLPAGQRRGLGYALKQHQRVWCLSRGIGVVTWTCDPLVQRNVAFNLHALGADVAGYLPNHYGAMDDAVNAGDETDRLELRWELESARAVAASQGRLPFAEPRGGWAVRASDGDGPVVAAVPGAARTVQLPRDVQALRRRDVLAARDWRLAVRDAVLGGLAAGAVVVGVTADAALVMEECT